MIALFSSHAPDNCGTAGRRIILAPARDASPRRSKTFREDGSKEEIGVDFDSDYWEWEEAFPMRKDMKRSGKAGKRAKKGFIPKATKINWKAGEVSQVWAVCD